MTLPASSNPRWSTTALIAVVTLVVGFGADRAIVGSEIASLQQSNEFILSELRDVKNSLESLKDEQSKQSTALRELQVRQNGVLNELHSEDYK